MKFLTKKSITQKIIIVLIISILFGFTFPTYSQAGIGGVLIDPIVDFIGVLFDAVIGGLQMFLVDGNFNNSGDSDNGLRNAFLINVDDFNTDSTQYAEFSYNPNGSSDKQIEESELSKNLWGSSNYFIPALKYTPQKIFSGLVPALDANFINPNQWEGDTNKQERSVAIQLKDTISGWYVALRNLAVIGLMSVLLYVGIRIVISSAASEKSKYKQMLVDWLVAMCLIFCLHYIMAFTTTIVNEISLAINGSEENSGNNIAVTVKDGDNIKVQFNTDLMGLIRFQMQADDVWFKLLYLIFYMAMVFYTCLFTFIYLKRVLTIAFLTLIAPLVAFTYPIDKIRDGKAQAFNLWLKEYVFNILIQPFHLIIYTVFVSSAVDLVANNPIFAIIALAFIGPAEKILRNFFGFNEAKTGGTLSSLAGIAGGTAAFNMVSRALNKGGKGGGGQPQKKNENIKTKPEASKPKFEEAFGNQGELTTGEEALEYKQNTETQDNNEQSWYAPNYSTTTPLGSGTQPFSGTNSQNNSQETPVLEPVPSVGEDNQGLWQRAWQTDENDTRGMGQYLGDGVKTLGNEAKTKLSETGLGQNAIKLKNSAVDKFNSTQKSVTDRINKIPKPLRNTAKGAIGVGKYVGKKAIRTTGKVASAVPGAMFGMAAGIAGDELGDIWKYTAAGAALSTAVTPRVINSARSGASNIKNAYDVGKYGEHEVAMRERHKNYMASKDLDEEYRKQIKNEDGSELTKAQLREMKEQGAYFDSIGIEGKNSVEAVALQERLRKEITQTNPKMSDEEARKRGQLQAAVIKKTMEEYSAKDLRDKDTVTQLREDLSKKCNKSGLNQADTEKTVNMIVSEMKKAKKVDNDY